MSGEVYRKLCSLHDALRAAGVNKTVTIAFESLDDYLSVRKGAPRVCWLADSFEWDGVIFTYNQGV